MTSLLFFPIYILPIIAIILFGYYTAENKKEEILFLKCFGYFFLGAFIFWIDMWPLPIGFLVGFFLLKPKVNTVMKKRVIIIGLSVALLSHLLIF
ncbi:hypothetical protein ACERII_25310 [Evansella sp. AB-rgal1]|uniref:hypothetical protein n=1 Tax=Evansella sp. AB-rgal1 TaxID=3242696 RepID=UPI00359D23B3